MYKIKETKMKKRISVILSYVVLICCCSVSAADSQPFSPVKTEYMEKLGILQGRDNGNELEANVTRAEAVTFIWRITGVSFYDIGYDTPSFNDISGHWAQDAIEKFYYAGYIDGTSDKTFEPERNVTGEEFVKILLSVMGYKNITIENAYDTAKESGLINDNTSEIQPEASLTRDDVLKLCFNALNSKMPDGQMLYKHLIDIGVYTENDLNGILFTDDVSDKTESFADKLNAQMPKDKNYMFSPLSIKMALAMAANGAEGETKDEILNAVGIDDIDAFNAQSKEMTDKYSKTDILNLNIANSIWINKDKTTQNFSDSYKKTISEFFNGEASITDNKNMVNDVNSWVSEKTNKKIPTIIDESDFWAMLINAIYFKGAWQDEFIEEETKKSEFTDRNNKKSDIDFMNQTSWMNYFNNDSLQIVELPYKNRVDRFSADGEYLDTDKYDDIDVSMFILMGDEDLTDVQALLDDNKLTNTFVKLSIPKFKVEYEASLSDMLYNMGIKKAFSDENTAEFKPMFDEGNMFISDVLHKTYITVDEKGTEAAAITAVGMTGSSLPPEPVEFIANKPFTFAIRDNISGEILFMGEYSFAD